VDPRFGRSPYHLIVDTEKMAFEAVSNASMNAPSGAGIGAAQVVAQRGVEAVLTGNLGPNSSIALSQAGIEMYKGVTGSIGQAVESFKRGNLSTAPSSGTAGFGYGRGRGGGLGMGMKRGMVMGRGLGMRGTDMGRGIYDRSSKLPMPPVRPMSHDQEREMLKQQLELLENQLSEIKKKLGDLGDG
jgi:predicted Fe-Mo cluster-binding NifX family protein